MNPAVPTRRLWLAVLCGYLSIGAAIQVIPDDAHERFRASEWAVGAAITAASVAAVVARPVAGRRADARGPREVVAVGGLLAAAGALGQLVAPSLPLLVLARLLVGAGEGALFTAAVLWVMTAAPAARRGRIVGHFGLSMWGGLAAGAPLGALLASAWGAQAVWCACLALPLAPAAAVLTARAPAIGASHRPWSIPAEVAGPALTLGLASYGYGTLNGFVVLRFDDAQLAGAGAALGVFGAAFLLCRLIGSTLVDRVAAPSLVVGASAVEAAGLAAVALAPDSATALAGVALCGAGTALIYPTLANLVAALVAPARRGVAVGALTSSWDAGLALAGVAGGAVIPLAGLRGPFLVAAALAAVAVVPLLRAADSPRHAPL